MNRRRFLGMMTAGVAAMLATPWQMLKGKETKVGIDFACDKGRTIVFQFELRQNGEPRFIPYGIKPGELKFIGSYEL